MIRPIHLVERILLDCACRLVEQEFFQILSLGLLEIGHRCSSVFNVSRGWHEAKTLIGGWRALEIYWLPLRLPLEFHRRWNVVQLIFVRLDDDSNIRSVLPQEI